MTCIRFLSLQPIDNGVPVLLFLYSFEFADMQDIFRIFLLNSTLLCSKKLIRFGYPFRCLVGRDGWVQRNGTYRPNAAFNVYWNGCRYVLERMPIRHPSRTARKSAEAIRHPFRSPWKFEAAIREIMDDGHPLKWVLFFLTRNLES